VGTDAVGTDAERSRSGSGPIVRATDAFADASPDANVAVGRAAAAHADA
jgi:hypothetical protein